MPKVAPIDQRKADHIKINLEQDVRSALTTGLENYHFTHEALPELDLNRIDTTLSLFGKQLAAPILISSMTGGTAEAETINLRLAEAAQEMKIAMGVGSQRTAIENPEQAKTFQVRRVAPDILLFANLGAVQFNYGYGIDQCKRAVDMIEVYGDERVWMNSACDWGVSDPLAVPKAALEMKKRGHSAAAIEKLIFHNPRKFLGQSPNFKLAGD